MYTKPYCQNVKFLQENLYRHQTVGESGANGTLFF